MSIGLLEWSGGEIVKEAEPDETKSKMKRNRYEKELCKLQTELCRPEKY